MREYKLSPAFFSQMRKRILIFGVPLMVLTASAVVWISAARIAREGNGSYLTSPVFFTVVILGAIVIGFSIRRSLQEQQRLWSSYRLILDENSVKRTQAGLPELVINYDEISRITEAPGAGLDIQTSKISRLIGVPGTLEDYSLFRLELAKRHAIECLPGSRAKWIPVLLIVMGLLPAAGFMIIFLAGNRFVSWITGILLFAVILASFLTIQRSTFITKRVKRASWLIWLPLMALGDWILRTIPGW